MALRVTIWNEYRHEKENAEVARVYPDGIHRAIADGLRDAGDFVVRTATLDDPEHGLTDEVLATTDVLVWWGHKAHGDVDDAIVRRVQERALMGMGLIVLHSGHFSKVFKTLMGTSCDLRWREDGANERLWVVNPAHPIVEGIGDYIDLSHEEMYGEYFDIPAPDDLVFVSWFRGGEVFRSGACFTRGAGRIFYFRPGHETFPTYFDPQIRRVIANAARWAAPVRRDHPTVNRRNPEPPLEPMKIADA